MRRRSVWLAAGPEKDKAFFRPGLRENKEVEPLLIFAER